MLGGVVGRLFLCLVEFVRPSVLLCVSSGSACFFFIREERGERKVELLSQRQRHRQHNRKERKMTSLLRSRRRHSGTSSGIDVSLVRPETAIVMKSASLTEESDERLRTLRRFSNEELRVGSRCGRGSFCDVYNVESESGLMESIHSTDSNNNNNSSNGSPTGKDPIAHKDIVVKRLSQDLEPSHAIGATMDLALEARVLSSLNHKNIVKIYGITKEGEEEGGQYSLVLERLHGVLDNRLLEWKDEEFKINKIQVRVSEMAGTKRRKRLLLRRLVVAFDISSALKYLHDRGIVFRDLKPSNIGFDAQGRAKLFDFGLAREVPKEEGQRTDVYKMSGNTGTLRYMAPEVAKYEPYNTSADVYSFGVLLWQIFSLDKPFEHFKLFDFMKHVVQGSKRPKLGRSWPSSIRNLIRKCWAPDLSDRPSMAVVRTIIAREIVAIETQTKQSSQVLSGGKGEGVGESMSKPLSRVSNLFPDSVFRRRKSY